MIRIISFVIIAFCLTSGHTTAQKILTFDFSTLTFGNEATANSNFHIAGINPSIISHGPGVKALDAAWITATGGTFDPGLFNSYDWSGNTIDPTKYIEFTISTAAIDSQFSINSIVIKHEKRSASRSQFLVLRTSLDNFVSDHGEVITIPRSENYKTNITTFDFENVIDRDINNPVTIKLYFYSVVNSFQTWGIGRGINQGALFPDDHIVVNGFVNPLGSPSIFISNTAPTDFSYFFGSGPSESKSFNLIGTNLSPAAGDLVVTGSANYEVSSDNSIFSSSLNVPYSGGFLPSTPIFIRLKAALGVNDYNNEIITVACNGAITREINCNGFVSPYNLVINEVFAGRGETNNNLTSSSTEDQFIELVNMGSSALPLNNFTISDLNGLVHTFQPDTLPVNQAIVVFGGGNLSFFSASLSQAAVRGLRFGETQDKITIADNFGNRLAIFTYSNNDEYSFSYVPGNGGGDIVQSLARMPDFDGPFFNHLDIPSNQVLFSPGRDNTDAGPLPVELSSFSAIVLKDKVKLGWRTETEVNNYGFDIERKVGSLQSTVGNPIGGTGWEKIGFVEGNGNSNSPKDYTFEDNSVTANKYSYRLKQIDNDGQYSYSKTVEVDLSVPLKFELSQNYPNPFNPVTTIRFSLPQAGFVKLTIFNLLGEEVTTLVNENREAGIYTVNFNASELNSGLYIYRIESNESAQTKKMMLLK